MSVKVKVYLLIALIVILIGVSVYIVLAKKKKNKNAAEVSKAIGQGVGLLGTDIDSLLFATKADTSYRTSDNDLKKLWDADGGILPDKPDNFKEVFLGKTKGQLKKMLQDFQSKYGIKLNDHINKVFDDTFGYDTDRYNQLLNIIRNAQ